MQGPFNSSASKRKPVINITSLIDVMFLLLIFFMVSSTFKEKDYAIDITLPKAESATEQIVKVHEITVDSGGILYLDNETMEEAGLREALLALKQSDPTAAVVLRADESADFGRVVRAIDIARNAGIVNLVIPTDRLGAAPPDRSPNAPVPGRTSP
jgi:biopolymer transport protein ExbD